MIIAWLLAVVGLGAVAPQVKDSLSGAGWQDDGSPSVAARELAQEHFGGNASSAIQVVVHAEDGLVTEGEGADELADITRFLGNAAWYAPAWLRKVLPKVTFAHD